MKRISLHIEIAIGDNEPEQRDSQLDSFVEHGDHYPTRPELHIGFRAEDDQ